MDGDPTEVALREGPEALFDLLSARLGASAGFKLLTLLAADDDGMRLVRPYSTQPKDFPCGAAEEIEDSPWFRRLFIEQKPVVANDTASIRNWLPGFTKGEALGYDSLVNLPIVVGGKVVGLMNVMDQGKHYDDRRVEALRNEAPLAALAILTRLARLPMIAVPYGGGN